jgi:hypothetical protein
MRPNVASASGEIERRQGLERFGISAVGVGLQPFFGEVEKTILLIKFQHFSTQ